MKRDLVVLAAITALLLTPSFIFGPGLLDSASYNYVWTKQFAEGLSHGQFYPRWLLRSFEGLGSPTFYFYPPFSYFIAGGFGALGLSTTFAINCAAAVLTYASGVSMRVWLSGKSSRPLLWASVYIAAPYHLADWYMRAALAEYSAFIWLPLIALGIEKMRGRWGPPILAASYAGLIFSHLPVALLASFALIAPLALFRGGWSLRIQLKTALAGLVGLGLASVYLLPALLLQGEVSRSFWWTEHFIIRNWSVFWRDSPIDWTTRSWTLPIIGALTVSAVGTFLSSRKTRRTDLAFWTTLTLATGILALGTPEGLWSLPLFAKVQFPWRILSVTEFAAITAIALAPNISGIALALAAVISIPAYASTASLAAISFQRAGEIHRYDADMRDAIEYLPAGFSAPTTVRPYRRADLSGLRGPLLTGPVRLLASDPGGRLLMEVTAPGRVTVRRFSFKGWRLSGPEGAIRTFPTGPGRLITFDAHPGRYELALVQTPEERLGEGVALIGLLGFVGWTAAILLERRRHLADQH